MTTAPDALPPQALLMNMIAGKWMTIALGTAAELAIADHLAKGPKTSAELASASGAHEDSLYRILRALATVGVFEEKPGRVFANNPLSECLRSDVPGSLAGMAKFQAASWHSAAWSELTHSARTGECAFEKAFGEQVFSWFGKHPDAAAIFNDAMTSISSIAIPAVLDAYDFGQPKLIVDVGGGHGTLLAAILKAVPSARGALYEMASVAEGAKAVIAKTGVAERVTIVPGDFFEGVHPGGDVYVLKHIIHDWSDAACAKILGHVRNGMTPDGRVLLVEQVVTPIGVPGFGKLIDLEMLAMTHGGRERTEDEFRKLFAAAGLSLTRIVPTKSPLSVIEARRA